MDTGSCTTMEQHLSTDAICLYKALARGDREHAETILKRKPDASRELLAWDLIGEDPYEAGRLVVRDPKAAMRRQMQEEFAAAAARVRKLMQIPELTDELETHFRAVQQRSGASSEFLDDPAVVNSRITDVVAGTRREILASQPGGPRKKETLSLALERDMAALDRGVRMRTLYRDTVRDHPVTADYARAMSSRASGRRAEYRTVVASFVRMIIVDREQAFIPDLVVDGSHEHAAWHVTDRALVAVLAEVFEEKWRRASPWHGELRPRRGRLPVDTVTGAGGEATTARQREIMRCLVGGMTQAAVARRIGVSKRTLEEEIAGLKRLSGSSTLMQLAHWWAHCPDRNIDDTAASAEPAVGTGGPGPAGAAVA